MNELEDLAPDEQLFHLAGRRGDARAPILNTHHVKVATRMLREEPERYAKLLGLMAGWHSLSVFKQNVQKWKAEGDSKLKQRKAEQEAEERLTRARQAGWPVVPVGKPVSIAALILQARPNLVNFAGDWLDYTGTHYVVREDRAIRKLITDWMVSGVGEEDGKPVHPNKRDIDEVYDALATKALMPSDEFDPPCWRDPFPELDMPPRKTISCRNGLLYVGGEKHHLYEHDARFFVRNSLPFGFDPDAPPPSRWMQFLDEVWPLDEGGKENQDALQEIFGHLLTQETKYQKVFMFVGAPGSGKGTIARVLEGLIGSANIASMFASKLGMEFGLKALLGKQVLVVPDLRLGKNSNISGITETLLSISGEDRISVGRKNQDDVSVRLATRAVLLSNMGVVLPDQSGALLQRLYPLVFKHGFRGTAQEDSGLTDKLLAELPGILRWALDGLRRLEARRHADGRQIRFVLTADGRRLLEDTASQSSSVKLFLDECCTQMRGATIDRQELFDAFQEWCDDRGANFHHDQASFGKEIAVASGYRIGVGRPRVSNSKKRPRVFTNVMLKTSHEESDEATDDY